jgi:16S rRNA (uracil1498-N3)-methyltransferase
VRVLRLQNGNEITLIDGKGRRTIAKITNADRKKLEFSILADFQAPLPKTNIHIAIAPTKNLDRFAFFLEKVVEIGVQEITPILTKNSERKVLSHDKIEKYALTALKQSGNLFLPVLNELVSFKSFMEMNHSTSQCLIAHCDEDNQKVELKNVVLPEKNVLILIGPEGDFTKEEVNLAKQKNFTPVSLGESRLRTETAGIVACHTVIII